MAVRLGRPAAVGMLAKRSLSLAAGAAAEEVEEKAEEKSAKPSPPPFEPLFAPPPPLPKAAEKLPKSPPVLAFASEARDE